MAFWVSPAHAQSRVFIEPGLADLTVGERQLVEVRIEGLPPSGLAGFQLTLAHDPSLVAIRNPNGGPGSPNPFAPLGDSLLECEAIRGQSPCPDPTWQLIATTRAPLAFNRQDPGETRIAYGTSGAATPPASAGTLLVFELEALGSGASLVSLEGVVLADASEPPQALPNVLDPLMVISGSSLPDFDGDGIPDDIDNCITVDNGPAQPDAGGGVQRDDDRDTFGNACDADLDGDLLVAPGDFFAGFRPCLGADIATSPGCAAADLDGDSVVGPGDFFAVLRPQLGLPPGPSGRFNKTADLNGDGIVSAADFFSGLRPCLGSTVANRPECFTADLDNDGLIGGSDFFGVFRPQLGFAP